MAVVKDDRGAREEIMARVRAAVQNEAPRKPSQVGGPVFFPTQGDLVERFQAESAANYVEVKLTANTSESGAVLKEVLDSLPAGEVWLQDTARIRELGLSATSSHPLRWSSDSGPAEFSRATVSLCEALVAMTGSILVSSGGCGGRGASVAAPCHIVLARVEQLVPDLETVLARAREIAFDNSFIGLITGCSRTADIEKKLVIGAHGPTRVVVILQS